MSEEKTFPIKLIPDERVYPEYWMTKVCVIIPAMDWIDNLIISLHAFP